jgi:hypothetical protein
MLVEARSIMSNAVGASALLEGHTEAELSAKGSVARRLGRATRSKETAKVPPDEAIERDGSIDISANSRLEGGGERAQSVWTMGSDMQVLRTAEAGRVAEHAETRGLCRCEHRAPGSRSRVRARAAAGLLQIPEDASGHKVPEAAPTGAAAATAL